MGETVTISKNEYTRLKRQASVDVEFLKELVQSLADIKENRVKRVR